MLVALGHEGRTPLSVDLDRRLGREGQSSRLKHVVGREQDIKRRCVDDLRVRNGHKSTSVSPPRAAAGAQTRRRTHRLEDAVEEARVAVWRRQESDLISSCNVEDQKGRALPFTRPVGTCDGGPSAAGDDDDADASSIWPTAGPSSEMLIPRLEIWPDDVFLSDFDRPSMVVWRGEVGGGSTGRSSTCHLWRPARKALTDSSSDGRTDSAHYFCTPKRVRH